LLVYGETAFNEYVEYVGHRAFSEVLYFWLYSLAVFQRISASR
jgi:hypothetical protein